MKPLELLSPSKINLCLDILGKDERTGLHFVNTLIYIDHQVCDRLVLERSVSGHNVLICEDPEVPNDASNTIFKALDLLGEKGWKVTLTKSIPLRSGRGGGSSNAASLLKAIGDLKGIPVDHLEKMGAEIGADVPCFLSGDNLVYCEGYGDQVVQSWLISEFPILYSDTKVNVSTRDAYVQLDLEECGKNSHKTDALLQKLNQGWKPADLSELQPYIHNDFEFSFFKNNPSWLGKGNLCGSGGMMWSL